MAQPTWITAADLGTYSSGVVTSIQLTALASAPATTISNYKLLNGDLPQGILLSESGLLSGTSAAVSTTTAYEFTVRATDNLANLRDRTFSLSLSGAVIPRFITPTGVIATVTDSVWTSIPILYTNPSSTNELFLEIVSGSLPTGLELTPAGVIQGYAAPPYATINAAAVTVTAYSTSSLTNTVSCYSTSNLSVGRIVSFSAGVPVAAGNFSIGDTYIITSLGTTDFTLVGAAANTIGSTFVATGAGIGTGTAYISFGGIVANNPYYIKEILTARTFTISNTQSGATRLLTDVTDTVTVSLPSVTTTTPITRTNTFAVKLVSELGGDSEVLSITVANQQLTKSANTRPPVILNTQPLTAIIKPSDPYAGYYILDSAPTAPAYIGIVLSGSFWTFKIIGHDFDGSVISYIFNGLPPGYNGDSATGWISGTVTTLATLPSTFSVSTYKAITNTVVTAIIVGREYVITSIGNTNFIPLGAVSNTVGVIFTAAALASAVDTGTVSEIIKSQSTYSFTVIVSDTTALALSWTTEPDLGVIANSSISQLAVTAAATVPVTYSIVSGSLPVGLVLQPQGDIVGRVSYEVATKVMPAAALKTFTFTVQVSSTTYSVISSSRTFTVTVSQNFTQPTDILYIKATTSTQDRNIIESLLSDTTLIPTSDLYRPTDDNFGKATEVIYIHEYGIHASDVQQYIAAAAEKNHYDRNITLGQIKTAQARDSQNRIVYEVVYSEIIDDLNNTSGRSTSKEISWATSINLNLGSYYTSITTVFTSSSVWYSSFTPGYARSLYPNSLHNMRTQIAEQLGQDASTDILPLWMTSAQSSGGSLGYTAAWVICHTLPGKSAQIAENIQRLWPHRLNAINFKIDRFLVSKSATYDYDNLLMPPAWLDLPSTPIQPQPKDSKDLPIIFPRRSILPLRANYPG